MKKNKQNKKKFKTPLLLSLFYWVFVDVYRVLKYGKKLHLYGIEGYFGLPGFGKTMALTERLDRYREKFGDNIYIFTNYNYLKQDAPFTDWKMLLKDYEKPCVFAWDEVQNEFNSRAFKDFPIELLTLLTQNRKGNGKMILYTAQRWARVEKVFRELSQVCYECKTRFGRLTSIKGYDWEDYEMLLSKADVNLRMKVRPKSRRLFVQSDDLRNQYDSFKMLETAKNKDYMDRLEIKKLYD